MRILGAVIAGGLSTRMGDADKLALPWEGQTLVAHVAARLSSQLPEIVVNMNAAKSQLVAAGTQVLPDLSQRQAGPLAGLEAVLKHGAAHGFTHAITCAGDTPFFPNDLAERLMNTSGEVRILRTGAYPQPLFAMWPVALQDELSAFLDDGETFKVMAFAKRYDLTMVDMPEPKSVDPFFNINTPEDLEEAKKLAAMMEASLV